MTEGSGGEAPPVPTEPQALYYCAALVQQGIPPAPRPTSLLRFLMARAGLTLAQGQKSSDSRAGVTLESLPAAASATSAASACTRLTVLPETASWLGCRGTGGLSAGQPGDGSAARRACAAGCAPWRCCDGSSAREGSTALGRLAAGGSAWGGAGGAGCGAAAVLTAARCSALRGAVK